MARLRADFWVAAHIRRCAVEGVPCVLRRRGAAEAGAIFVKLDLLDGTASLFGPAPQALVADAVESRTFVPMLVAALSADVEERMRREARFDSDLWLIEIEDAAGRHFLDLAREPPET